MRRYFFHLRDGGRGYVDHLGVHLADDGAAAEHARRVAAELVKNRERLARLWRIEVQDEERHTICQITLVSQDQTLEHFSPMCKKLIEKTVHRRAALVEAVAASRAAVRRSRALVARSRGRPHLAAEQGELI
jgi:hypothetical protein